MKGKEGEVLKSLLWHNWVILCGVSLSLHFPKKTSHKLLLWEGSYLHIDKSQFNIVNYLFIWQSGRFGFNLSINVFAYLESVCGWEGVEVAEGWGGWGRDITQEKGFPFIFAAFPLINRLCTHAHSCQSPSASHYHCDLSFFCPAPSNTLMHTKAYTRPKLVGIVEWVGSGLGSKCVRWVEPISLDEKHWIGDPSVSESQRTMCSKRFLNMFPVSSRHNTQYEEGC